MATIREAWSGDGCEFPIAHNGYAQFAAESGLLGLGLLGLRP